MAVDRFDGRRGLGTLLRELAEGSATLVRREVELARLELTSLVRSLGVGTGMVAGGGVVALLGALTLLTGIIMLVGDQWLRDRYWLAALLVLVITGGIAVFFVKKGSAMLSPHRLAPGQTVATLKEDKEWLRRQLTSGATSS